LQLPAARSSLSKPVTENISFESRRSASSNLAKKATSHPVVFVLSGISEAFKKGQNKNELGLPLWKHGSLEQY
jgi:hypothetical protein